MRALALELVVAATIEEAEADLAPLLHASSSPESYATDVVHELLKPEGRNAVIRFLRRSTRRDIRDWERFRRSQDSLELGLAAA